MPKVFFLALLAASAAAAAATPQEMINEYAVAAARQSPGFKASAQRGAESTPAVGRKARVSRSQPLSGDCARRISSASIPSKKS